jgi:hypothetical protein
MGLLNVVVAQLCVKDEKLFKDRSLMLAPRSCSKSCVIATSIVERRTWRKIKKLLKIFCNCNFYRGKENLEKDQ